MSQTTEIVIAINGKIVYKQDAQVLVRRKDIEQRPGVYLIRDKETGELLYIGTSKNIQRRAYRNPLYDEGKHKIEAVYVEDDPTRIWLEAILVSSLKPLKNHHRAIRLSSCGGHPAES